MRHMLLGNHPQFANGFVVPGAAVTGYVFIPLGSDRLITFDNLVFRVAGEIFAPLGFDRLITADNLTFKVAA